MTRARSVTIAARTSTPICACGSRGFADLRALLVVAGVMAATIVACGYAGHALVARDRAISDAAAAEWREAQCERGWARTVERSAAFRERIEAHLAIADEQDAECACPTEVWR